MIGKWMRLFYWESHCWMALGNLFHEISLRCYAQALRQPPRRNLRLWERKTDYRPWIGTKTHEGWLRRPFPVFPLPPLRISEEPYTGIRNMSPKSKELYNQPWRKRAVQLVGGK